MCFSISIINRNILFPALDFKKCFCMSKTTYIWVKNHDLRQLCTFTCLYFCARIRFGNRNYRESYYFTKSFQIFQTFFAGSVFISPALRRERKPAFSFIARYRFWALLSWTGTKNPLISAHPARLTFHYHPCKIIKEIRLYFLISIWKNI